MPRRHRLLTLFVVDPQYTVDLFSANFDGPEDVDSPIDSGGVLIGVHHSLDFVVLQKGNGDTDLLDFKDLDDDHVTLFWELVLVEPVVELCCSGLHVR